MLRLHASFMTALTVTIFLCFPVLIVHAEENPSSFQIDMTFSQDETVISEPTVYAENETSVGFEFSTQAANGSEKLNIYMDLTPKWIGEEIQIEGSILTNSATQNENEIQIDKIVSSGEEFTLNLDVNDQDYNLNIRVSTP